MRLRPLFPVAVAAAMLATPALASTVLTPSGDNPLTLMAIFANAAAPVQLIALLLVAGLFVSPIVAALRPHARLLRAINKSALPLGFAAAAYTLLAGAVGIANLGATPSLAVVAPGLAEALMMAMLGLLTAGVARLASELTSRRKAETGVV
ncbi:hypothetical protein J2X45_000763 [Caulobacter sp. BE264]|uniref:hypothetical protein n=1 Tax=Caulobacter sp. BE264 TaxID=2817724 RepID=UPI0028610B4F|nr:hypothetical protein [Caulobacter sp. BE264]MDR7229700.1 hypothetical protein [Caulobacter sp. BE264]